MRWLRPLRHLWTVWHSLAIDAHAPINPNVIITVVCMSPLFNSISHQQKFVKFVTSKVGTVLFLQILSMQPTSSVLVCFACMWCGDVVSLNVTGWTRLDLDKLGTRCMVWFTLRHNFTVLHGEMKLVSNNLWRCVGAAKSSEHEITVPEFDSKGWTHKGWTHTSRNEAFSIVWTYQ